MDVARMPFPEESFQNVLFSFNGFEQIPGKRNRKEALRRMYEVLLPGGHLILTTRSGLAVGRRSLGWIAMTLVHPYHYLAGTPGQSIEFGDKFWGDLYCHYMNPFVLKRSFQTMGFDLVDFNSERNLVKGRPSNVLTNFSNDRILYYVLRKRSL
jgi:ubiquinone/menaquinone biosynthesis C-methylase UbiE